MKALGHILILFLVIQIVTVIFQRVSPAYRETASVLSKRNEEQGRLKQIEELRTLFQAISTSEDLSRLTASQSYFELYLPTSFRQYEVMAILLSLLRQNGFPYQQVHFEPGQAMLIPEVSGAVIQEITGTLSLAGSFENIRGFIRDLEAHTRIFRVRNLEVRQVGVGGGNVVAKIKIATYILELRSVVPTSVTSVATTTP